MKTLLFVFGTRPEAVKMCPIIKEIKKRGKKKQGFFMYGNHTQQTGDAVIPSLCVNPRSVYIVVHSNNVSMPYLGRVTPYMGALPLPDNLKAARNFKEAVHTRYKQGNIVLVYPEAHIWPYYTGVRPFPDSSFAYPIKCNAPTVAFFTAFSKPVPAAARTAAMFFITCSVCVRMSSPLMAPVAGSSPI